MNADAPRLPRVLVVDTSPVARLVATRALTSLAHVVGCSDGEEALAALTPDTALIVTALRLPGMNGQALAQAIRAHAPHASTPILAVSGDVSESLLTRAMGHDITDYFDKREGVAALGAFLRTHLLPQAPLEGRVFHIEDSRVIALTTRRILEKRGATVDGVGTAEEAIAILERDRYLGLHRLPHVVLTDVNLKGDETGLDVIAHLRGPMGLTSAVMPVVVTTGDENPHHQAELIRAGADDLVEKPVSEAVLVAKLRFHMWRSQHARPPAEGPSGA